MIRCLNAPRLNPPKHLARAHHCCLYRWDGLRPEELWIIDILNGLAAVLCTIHGCRHEFWVSLYFAATWATPVAKNPLEPARRPKTAWHTAAAATHFGDFTTQSASAWISSDRASGDALTIPYQPNLGTTDSVKDCTIFLGPRLPTLNPPRIVKVDLLRVARIANANQRSTTLGYYVMELYDLFVLLSTLVLVDLEVVRSCGLSRGRHSTSEESKFVITLDKLHIVSQRLSDPSATSVWRKAIVVTRLL